MLKDMYILSKVVDLEYFSPQFLYIFLNNQLYFGVRMQNGGKLSCV